MTAPVKHLDQLEDLEGKVSQELNEKINDLVKKYPDNLDLRQNILALIDQLEEGQSLEDFLLDKKFALGKQLFNR